MLNPVLKEKYLEEFIQGLEELASYPLRKRFFEESDMHYQGAVIVHNTQKEYYNYMLKAVRQWTENAKNPLPFKVIEDIADLFHLHATAEPETVPDEIRLNSLNMPRILILPCAFGKIVRCFHECSSLQEKQEKTFISFLRKNVVEELPPGIDLWSMAYQCLQKNADIAHMSPKNPRRVFHRAEADEMLKCFERKMADAHPDIGPHQLRQKCKKEMQFMAKQTCLPMPGRRASPK